MIIRIFQESDIERVYAIETTSFSHPFPKHLIKQMNDFGVGFLVASYDDFVVGYIIFDVRKDNSGHIISLAVDLNYRRQNVASMLILFAIRILNLNKVNRIYLEVKRTNNSAISFYSKFNFKIIDVKKKYYEDGEDALIMERDLLEDSNDN